MRNIEARHLAVAVVLMVVLVAGAWYWFAHFDSSAPVPVEPILETHANALANAEVRVEPMPVEHERLESLPETSEPPSAGEGTIVGTVYRATGDRAFRCRPGLSRYSGAAPRNANPVHG